MITNSSLFWIDLAKKLSEFFFKKFPGEINLLKSLKNNFEEMSDFFFSGFDKRLNRVESLLNLPLIFWCSAEFNGCVKLINKKDVNIAFFEMPRINANKFN